MAAGRVLAAAVVSDVDVPGFDRATMDGYAVVAESTEGASAYNRLPLRIIGDSLPAQPFGESVACGRSPISWCWEDTASVSFTCWANWNSTACVNRNRGSGTRVLLDRVLDGIKPPGRVREHICAQPCASTHIDHVCTRHASELRGYADRYGWHCVCPSSFPEETCDCYDSHEYFSAPRWP
jgi:hypothetical protein